MTYSYEQRKKIKQAIKAAEKKDFITPMVQKRLREASTFLSQQQNHIKILLGKPIK